MNPPRWFYLAFLAISTVIAGAACYAAWAVGARGRYAHVAGDVTPRSAMSIMDTRTGAHCIVFERGDSLGTARACAPIRPVPGQ